MIDPSVLSSIARLDLIARTVVEGFLIGLHHSPYRGLSQEFTAHRPYIAGDEMRRVDWRVYARTDRLYVKEFEEDTNSPVRLLLDVSDSLRYAPRGVSKLDYSRYLSAALAYLAVRQNDCVGLVCFNEEARVRLATRGDRRHLHVVFATLEGLKAGGATRLKQSILREAAQWKRRGLVILVSDLYDQPQEIVDAVTRVRRVGHDMIVFHLLDLVEKSLAYRGVHEFHDLETGATLLADADRVRKDYVGRMTEVCAFYRREIERAGADYALLDTSEPLDRALAIYLRRRRAKRRQKSGGGHH